MATVREAEWPRAKPGPHTFEDWVALPEDGPRHELLEGDLCVVPTPIWLHQRVVGNLFLILKPYVKARGLGEVVLAPMGVKLSERNTLEPDLFFVAAARLHLLEPNGWMMGPPDLAVEVLSPGTARRDRTIKRDLYACHGVGHYWLIDPELRTLEAFELGSEDRYRDVGVAAGEGLFRPTLFDDLEIRLADLWA